MVLGPWADRRNAMGWARDAGPALRSLQFPPQQMLDVFHESLDQINFAVKMDIKCPLSHTGFTGDFCNIGAVDPILSEYLFGGIEDGPAGLFSFGNRLSISGVQRLGFG